MAAKPRPYRRRLRTDLRDACRAVSTAGLDADDDAGARVWIERLAEALRDCELHYLLAFSDDGVVWGRIEPSGGLVTAHDAEAGNAATGEVARAVSPPLATGTLREARLFGEKGEVLLWRDGDGRFHARLIHEAAGGEAPRWTEGYDEPQLLWGTDSDALEPAFRLWTEGANGLRHALPVAATLPHGKEGRRPPRLRVRHYLAPEAESPLARVEASRLVGFEGVGP